MIAREVRATGRPIYFAAVLSYSSEYSCIVLNG